MIQRRVFIRGEVQGVGFRASTLKQALQRSSVRGYVRNLEDGRVEAVFSGDDQDVLQLVAWCRRGPSTAQVTEIHVLEEAVDLNLMPFHVERLG